MDPTYLVGNRVYRGASNAPTRGQVDPMGYIERGLRGSPVGADGMSDSRSGLAQAAMQRLGAGGGPSMSQPSAPQQLPPQPQPLFNRPDVGFTVSATGRLLPSTPEPLQQTMQSPVAPDPGMIMQAAQQRLQHHVKQTETLGKHHLTMEKLKLQAAKMLQQFSQQQGASANG